MHIMVSSGIFGPPDRPRCLHRVSTATPGARPLSPVHEDRFHLLAFAPCPGFLYDYRAR